MKVKHQPIIETNRLLIDEFTEDDQSFILDLVNSPGWLSFIGDRNVRNTEDAKDYINNKLRKGYEERGFGLYKVSLKDTTPIGVCGLLKRNSLDNIDIGYAILPAYERKGYTFEAAHAIIDFAFQKLNLQIILGITSPENLGSQLLLKKLGFTFDRKEKLPAFEGDSMIFSIIKK